MAVDKNKRAEILGAIPLFERCSRRELGQVAGLMIEADFAAGKVLTREGQDGALAFVIVSGEVKATRGDRQVDVLGPGTIVGELALIDGAPRSATVTTTTETSVLEINREDFTKLLNDSPDFTINLLKALAGRIRSADAAGDLGFRAEATASSEEG